MTINVDRNEGLTYEFESQTTTPLAVELRHQGELVHTQNSVYSGGKQRVIINTDHFPYNGEYDLMVGSDNRLLDATTPLLTMEEMQAIAPQLTEGQARFVEEGVRYVIEEYTQQVFAPVKAVREIRAYGSENRRLVLPGHIVSADSSMFRVTDEGWGLAYLPPDEYTVAPIVVPGYDRYFSNGKYAVAGVWGWDTIPAKVKFAAKKLFNTFACTESMWRDRYVKDISTMEWKLSFMGQAFLGTGDVVVDQILGDFVVHKIGVV